MITPDDLPLVSQPPEAVCCSCHRGPLVSLAPPLCGNCHPTADREGAALWRKDHPTASVFSVGPEEKLRYMRYATGWLKP